MSAVRPLMQFKSAHRPVGLPDRRGHPLVQRIEDRRIASGNADMQHHVGTGRLECKGEKRAAGALALNQVPARENLWW